MDPVANTGLLVAALRAQETKREDRLFEDPFAEALAGEAGLALLEKRSAAATAGTVPIIEVRTRWYDEAVARAQGSGVRQFVLLAAGMDARSYRLEWPAGTRVYELDRPEVLEAKARVLSSATPRCERLAIGVDLSKEWEPALLAHGFDRGARTTWFVEGLLQYLPREAVQSIFAAIESLSAPGSIVLYDVPGQSLLESPVVAPLMQMMRDLGSPWLFGTDDPASLLPSWTADVTDAAVIGNAWKRWPFPAAPPGIPGIPRTYLVEARKA